MIGLEELYALSAENEQKIAELQAENRVLGKLIAIENSKVVEQPIETEEVPIEVEQQDEIC